MSALATRALGTRPLAGLVVGAAPSVSITAPVDGSVVSTPTVTVSWTYSSPIARPQAFYRILLQGGGDNLVDTGNVPGAVTSVALSYELTSFTTYRVFVAVSDGISRSPQPLFDGYSWSDVTFSTGELVVLPDANDKVGSIYEIAINGVGYMLADTKERPIVRQAAHLEGERLVTGDTPFDEAVDRYSFVAHSDWTGGEGQLMLRRERSDRSRYFYSEWVNPFEPGEIRCLPTPQQHIATTYTGGPNRAVVAGDSVYVQTGSTQLTALDVPGGTPVVFSTGNPGGLFDTATDGTYWYATDGAQIRRNNTPANPGVNWSTVNVTAIEWCSDRLAGLDDLAVPPVFTTFTPAGLEENPGGWQSFPDASLRGLCGGNGHIWFGVNRAFNGEVRAWQVDSAAGSTFIALTLPEGEQVDNLYFYLGNVMLASRTEDDRIRIYRCVAGPDGLLTPQFIVEYQQTFFNLAVVFAGMDRFVAFAWFSMTRDPVESGIGVIDLESGGYARWQAGGGTNGFTGEDITSVVRWAGDFGFVVRDSGTGGGFYGAAETPSLHEGFIETSVDDLESNITKALVEVALTTKPLNGSIEVSISANSNDTWQPVGAMSGTGATSTTIPMERQLKSVGIRLDMTPSGSAGPVVLLVTARVHPLGISDQVIVLPVRCADRLLGLNEAELPESRAGLCMAQLRTLESFTAELVSFQDIDWLETGAVYRCEVQGVQVEDLVGVFDKQQGRRVNSGVAQVTLRRTMS